MFDVGYAENPSPGPSPKRRGEKDKERKLSFSPLRFGEGPGEGFSA
jgi:hypothetical protein